MTPTNIHTPNSTVPYAFYYDSEEGKFHLAGNGNFKGAYTAEFVALIEPGGAPYTARVKGGKFDVRPDDDPKRSKMKSEITFLDWDNKLATISVCDL